MQIPKELFSGYKYRKWLEGSEDLDYFRFANYCNLPETETNAHYGSILRILENSADPDTRIIAKKAHTLFSRRKGKRNSDAASSFFVKYQKLWKHDQDNNEDIGGEIGRRDCSEVDGSIKRMRKRRLEALERINNTFMEQLEEDAKKMRYEEAARFVPTLPTSSWHVKDVFNYDDRAIHQQVKNNLSKHERRSLKKEFGLVESERSNAFKTYISNISNTSPSLNALQIAIRTPPVTPSEFDYYLHEDYRAAEKLLGHFIDLIQAPRKFLHSSKCLERTAACLTTIYVINTIFTPKMTPSISNDNKKWDGLGLPVRNRLAASVVSEFAGGINVGTLSKRISDEVKIKTNAGKVVDQSAAFCNKHDHAKVYCLLYYDMTLSMDILIEEKDKYIKKNLMKIKLPQTEIELKQFAGQLDLLLQWRDTVVAHAEAMQKEE